MGMFNNPRVANATAILALVVATSTGAYAANSVRSGDIVNGEVKTKDLAKNAVKSPQIKDGSINAADLAANAAPKTAAYAVYRDNDYNLPLATDAFQNVLTLSIPQAGSYIVFAKTNLDNDKAGQATGTCRLTAGGNSDQLYLTVDDGAAFDDFRGVALMVTTTFAGPGTATLECAKANGSYDLAVAQRKIVAVKVDSLVNTGATSPRGSARAETK